MEVLAKLENPQSRLVTECQPARASAGDLHLNTKAAGSTTQWWFDARGLHDVELLSAVERANCTHIVVDHADWKNVVSRKEIVVSVDTVQQLDGLDYSIAVLTRSDEIRRSAVAGGLKAGLLIEVDDLESGFPYCVSVCERGDDFVVIDIKHATYIPYELLIAKTEGKHTKVLRSVPISGLSEIVDDVNQSLNALATMECGVGVLFRTRNAAAIESLTRNLEHRRTGRLPLLPARVDEVQHTGLGHRVCVDTTSMMSAEEGMLIGSTGWGGLFVCSETHYLPHMNLREFRVNAGAVHSYIWAANGSALYLSEMGAGSEVLCVNLHGEARAVCVGRAKIERRPMLKISCSVAIEAVPGDLQALVTQMLQAQERVTPAGEHPAFDGKRIRINAFLQNDWHVRLMGADGKVRHTTLVRPGDELLAHIDAPGRHTGLRVAETIVEK